jgi:DNA-binding response OmpR family regulator
VSASPGGIFPSSPSARWRQEARDLCLAAGMDDFRSKPIRAAELFAAIERQVGAARGIPGSARPQDGDGPPVPDPPA